MAESFLLIRNVLLSTITVNTTLLNVNFDQTREEEIVKRMIEDGLKEPVVGISSMYVPTRTYTLPGYERVKIKTSKRGRKPKPKIAKTKGQKNANGRSFKSSIEVHVARSITRQPPIYPDTNSKYAKQNDDGTETFLKIYKIKVFRNGAITISGVLNNDYNDLAEPLTHLLEFIRRYFPEAELSNVYSPSTNNYKCRVGFEVDTYELRHILDGHNDGSIPMSMDHILEFFARPDYSLETELGL